MAEAMQTIAVRRDPAPHAATAIQSVVGSCYRPPDPETFAVKQLDRPSSSNSDSPRYEPHTPRYTSDYGLLSESIKTPQQGENTISSAGPSDVSNVTSNTTPSSGQESSDRLQLTNQTSIDSGGDRSLGRVATATGTDTIRHLVHWDDLTAGEKQACRGFKYPSLRTGKHAWSVSGSFKELYRNRLQRVLVSIINQNKPSIVKKSQHAVCLEPLLLSTFDDGRALEATIMVLTGDAKVGERAKTIIQKSSKFEKHNCGFRVEVECSKINIIWGDASTAGLYTREADVFSYACGRSALVKKLPFNSDATWIRTTLGGVIQARGAHYALIAAHSLLRCVTSGETSDSDRSDVDGDLGSDDEASSYVSCDSEGDAGSGNGHQRLISPPPLPAFALYTDWSGSAHQPPVDTDSSTAGQRPSRPAFIGRIDACNTRQSDESSISLVSTDNDWALIPILDPQFEKVNCFVLPDSSPCIIRQIQQKEEYGTEKTYIGAGSGLKEVSIIGSLSSLILPWSNVIHDVLSVDRAIEHGDSGSWLFDCDGYLYGVAIAAAPGSSMTFILKARDLFASIASQLAMDVPIDTILSTPSMDGTVGRENCEHSTSDSLANNVVYSTKGKTPLAQPPAATGATSSYDGDSFQSIDRKDRTMSRKGCRTCKLRHIPCDEQFPQCRNCSKHSVRCSYMDTPAAVKDPLEGAMPPDTVTSSQLRMGQDPSEPDFGTPGAYVDRSDSRRISVGAHEAGNKVPAADAGSSTERWKQHRRLSTSEAFRTRRSVNKRPSQEIGNNEGRHSAAKPAPQESLLEMFSAQAQTEAQPKPHRDDGRADQKPKPKQKQKQKQKQEQKQEQKQKQKLESSKPSASPSALSIGHSEIQWDEPTMSADSTSSNIHAEDVESALRQRQGYNLQSRDFFATGRVFEFVPPRDERMLGSGPPYFKSGVILQNPDVSNHPFAKTFVVITPKPEHCICCPIFNYGLEELRAGIVSTKDIATRAIVYSDKDRPRYRPGEPQLEKEAFPLSLANENHTIFPGSRIDFARYSSVAYGSKVKAIGMIPGNYHKYLIEYATEEFFGSGLDLAEPEEETSRVLARPRDHTLPTGLGSSDVLAKSLGVGVRPESWDDMSPARSPRGDTSAKIRRGNVAVTSWGNDRLTARRSRGDVAARSWNDDNLAESSDSDIPARSWGQDLVVASRAARRMR